MTKEPPKFEDVVKRLLTTPPKPHTAVAPKKSKADVRGDVNAREAGTPPHKKSTR